MNNNNNNNNNNKKNKNIRNTINIFNEYCIALLKIFIVISNNYLFSAALKSLCLILYLQNLFQYLRLQPNERWRKFIDLSLESDAAIFRDSYTLNTEDTSSSVTSVTSYLATCCRFQYDSNLHSNLREKLKPSRVVQTLPVPVLLYRIHISSWLFPCFRLCLFDSLSWYWRVLQ